MRWISARSISACVAAALVIAVLTFWAVSALTSPARPKAHSDNSSLGIMKMMQDAKDLPEQRYEAH
jgi:hypothetical protein